MSEERSKESLIERIRKILAKTEDAGCTEAESQKAFALASRLMAEHNLTMDEVERKEGGEQSWLEDDACTVSKWTLEDNLAWGIVHQHFFIEGYFTHQYVDGNVKKVLMFFGRPDNVQTAKWTFNALLEAFDRLFGEYRKRTGAPASDRRIFISGVASGFSSKMTDEKRAMEVERDLLQGKTSGSTALALAGIREQTLMAYKEHNPGCFKKNGEKRTARGNYANLTGSASAFEAGQRAGRSLNLNRSIGGGSQSKGITNS